jgi:DNA (cytosine-5)-methyltransferase 1
MADDYDLGMRDEEARRTCGTSPAGVGTHRVRPSTCIEGFCGAGGLGLGLHRAGFEILTAFDADAPSISTYQRNVSSNAFVARAEELTGDELLRRAGVVAGSVDLFAAGPPCQGFSKQKRGAHEGDARNDLILEYARLVREVQPRFFLLENVALFSQKRGRHYLQEVYGALSDYHFYPHVYNSADYGVAQTRERFILVGRHRSIDTPFQIPRPTVANWLTVGDVLGGLPEPPEDYSSHPDFPNHQRARVTEANIRRFSFVPPGGGWPDIPDEYRIPCHRGIVPRDMKGGWPDVYGRLRWDAQCPTITRGFDSFTRGRYGHPISDRPLTPREAARLQGFPDWFVFQGNRWDVRSQIGNAVPPPIAEAIGREIRRSLLAASSDATEYHPPRVGATGAQGAFVFDAGRSVVRV